MHTHLTLLALLMGLTVGLGAAVACPMMILEQQSRLYTPNGWAPANTATTVAASLLGTNQRFPVPRLNPLEYLILQVDVRTDTTGSAPAAKALSAGIVAVDNWANLIKRVTLECASPQWGNYKAVDYSGVGLLEYNANAGLNLDTATLEWIRLALARTTLAVDTSYSFNIKVPIVYPNAAEPLLTRTLLPIHIWDQDPVLSIDLESEANMLASGHFVGVRVSVFAVYREMTKKQTENILANGGFIKSDLIESYFDCPLGASGDQRFSINPPGSYLALNFRHYLGGNATASRDDVSLDTPTNAGASGAGIGSFGKESIWRLETNSNTKRQWRWKNYQTVNQYSRPLNNVSQTTSPGFAGALASGTLFQPPASVMLDFVSDGLEFAGELGSVLDVNIPQNSGLKMEVVGPWQAPASATIASRIAYGGHRLWGDLSAFKAPLANLKYA